MEPDRDERKTLDLAKVNADLIKVNAEIGKLVAETAKITAETRWYPVVAGMGGVLALAVIVIKLLA